MVNLLLLTREKHPTDRAIINELWLNEYSKNDKVHWIAQSNKNNSLLFRDGNNIFFSLPSAFQIPILNFLLITLFKTYLVFTCINRYNIDIIQVRNGILESYICIIFSKLFSIPLAFHLSSTHGFDDIPLISKYRSGVKKWCHIFYIKYKIYLYKSIIKNSDIFMPISESMSKRMKKFITLDSKIIFPLNLSASSQYLKLKRVETKSLIISFTGGIGWREELLLDIVEKTLEKRKDVLFLFTCLTSKHMISKERIIEMAEEKKIRDKILFFFNLPYKKVPQILKFSDIGMSLIPPEKKFIVSSPSKLVDYMSLGIPVVCNNEIIEQRKIIAASESGILVKYDSNEISKALLQLVENKLERFEMGRKGKKWIKENRTFENLSRDVKRIYERSLQIEKR